MGSAGAIGGSEFQPDISVLMAQADAAYRQGQMAFAIEFCDRILAIRSDFVPAKILSAVAHLRNGQAEVAEQMFLAILQTEQNCFPAYLWLGTHYSHVGRHEASAEMALHAVRIRPQDKDARFLLARAHFALGEFQDAAREFERTLSIHEEHGEAHAMLGALLQQLGRFEDADRHLLRAIELTPFAGDPYYDLAIARKWGESEEWLVDRFEEATKQPNLQARELSSIEFALGKAYDDRGEYQRASRHYQEANRLALRWMRSLGMNYDAEKIEEDFGRAERSLATCRAMEPGSDSELPVLVVGMARSGAGLLEQILSCHSQIAAAGEANYWLDRIGVFHAEERPPTEHESERLADKYLETLTRMAPEAPFVIDRTPHNFVALGWIRGILPNARIIHVRRDLRDLCLSNYTTHFPFPMDYSHSLRNIAHFASHYDRLMAFWRMTLPSDRYVEIDYEDLIEQPAEKIRSILRFLGLEWEAACLRHDLNPNQVRTPSRWQVRQPLYRDSVGRWRHYQDLIDMPCDLPG
ncbi:MAG: sulfotransferase [Fimbriimonas sp.]|nr:sulfotransferase [Fimbriimonas sp.]